MKYFFGFLCVVNVLAMAGAAQIGNAALIIFNGVVLGFNGTMFLKCKGN